MTQAIVSLQGLQKGNAFRCSNVSASVGLKSFCLWCLEMGGAPKQLPSILGEVHYRMMIECYIYWSFAGMNTSNVLHHHSGCKAKCDKGMCRTGGTGKGEEIAQEEVQVQGKGDILTTQLSGHQRITRPECHSTPSV